MHKCWHLSLYLLLLVCCGLWPQALMAKQIQYQHSAGQVEQQFSYSWQHQNATYHLKFAIPTSSFNAMPNTQPAFSNAIMQREIEVALLKYAQTIDPKSARISVQRQSTKIEYGVKSTSRQSGTKIMERLKTISKEARRSYLDSHFYTDYTSLLGQSAIKHDHAKYAHLSHEHLRPIVDAIKAMQQNSNDPREFIRIALSWMQSIPYSTLEDRISSNGAGFVSPKDLLQQNQGDCDSKATFLAALMKAYSTGVRQKMVLLPEHALLAVAIGARPNDRSINHEGIDYVLLEAAGPGYFDIGQAADTTLMGIRNRQYTLETM